jgi:hypothetical protein
MTIFRRILARGFPSSYPFRGVIGSDGMSLQQFAATIPAKFNVRGIERVV